MNGVHVGVHFEFRIQTRGIGVFSLVGCGFLRRPQLQFFLVEFWICWVGKPSRKSTAMPIARSALGRRLNLNAQITNCNLN